MRSSRSGRRALLAVGGLAAALCASLTSAPPASAAEPTLTGATLDVRPDPASSSATVREEISVRGVAKGDQVRNLLTRFDGVRVTGLEVTAADRRVRPRAEEQRQVTILTFPSPASGELTYEVTYRVESAGDATELPLVVPAYSGGEERVVELSYRIPDGYHLQGSPFPVGIGETGCSSATCSASPPSSTTGSAPPDRDR